MRTILLLLVLITLASAVCAAETEKWVYPGEPFTFDDETYYAFSDTSRMSVIIQSNSSRLILDIGECENENFVRYCYEEVASQTDLDHIKFDTDNNILYGMKLSLETLGPKLKISQKYSTTKPDVNARIDGTITLENTGNQRAYDVTVEWVANDSISMRACSECERGPRSFTKSFSSLDVDEKREIAFSFNVNEATSFASSMNTSYEYEGQLGSVGPLTQSFSIVKPYSATLTKAGTASVGQWIDASFTVKNTGDNDIIIDAEPIRNSSLRYENTRFSTERVFDGLELGPGESETHTFRAVSTKAGTYGNGYAIRVERDGEVFEETITNSFEWKLTDVTLIAQLSKQAPASGDANTLYVTVQNTGGLVFRNLKVAYTGEIDDETTIDAIGTDKTLEVFEERFRHPKTDTRLERTMNVTLTYDTQYGETQREERTISYSIIPINESYEIRRVIEPREPATGSEFTVSVYGRKNVDSAVQYSQVVDRLSGARIEQGNNKLVPIESPDEELLYQYEAVRNDERFAIITSVDASFLEQEARISETYATFNLSDEDVENAIDTIDPSTVTGTIDRNETAPEENETETEEPEAEPERSDPFEETEEPGFFGKIIRWFSNLFG